MRSGVPDTETNPMRRLLIIGLLATTACIGTSETDDAQRPGFDGHGRTWIYEPDLPVSQPPFRQVHANWKHRLDQPYVYVEYVGPYFETGRLLPSVHQALRDAGLEPSGPPFALFYDDPGAVPADQLRSRACVPIAGMPKFLGKLSYDVLPSQTVAYAVIGGAYPDVPRSYPGIYGYMNQMGWIEDGPVREIYLVPPGAVSDYAQLMTEVQIPVVHGR